MGRAAADLGFGGEGGWLKALRHVSAQHAAPGGQPAVIKRLADEAIEFLEERDLVRPSAAAAGPCFCGLGSPNARPG
eukprot:SAG11_NODE_1705_length_4412_cov_5.951078_7_plen_77_part_00